MKKAAGIILLTAGIISLFWPTWYWFNTPELTEMQIFLEFWWLILIGAALAFSGERIIKLQQP